MSDKEKLALNQVEKAYEKLEKLDADDKKYVLGVIDGISLANTNMGRKKEG